MTDDDDHLTDEPKLRVLVNSNANMSRGKMAAHVAHAVLTAAGVHPHIPVVVRSARSHPRSRGCVPSSVTLAELSSSPAP